MRPSQKRKRSLRSPRVTPRISGLKPRCEARSSSRASAVLATSCHQSTSPVGRQFQTEFQIESGDQVAHSEVLSDDDLAHVIAAIDMKDYGTVGCAYYSAEEEKMYLLGDSHSGESEIIEARKFALTYYPLVFPWVDEADSMKVINHIKPTVILVPPRVDMLGIQGHSQNLAQESGISEKPSSFIMVKKLINEPRFILVPAISDGCSSHARVQLHQRGKQAGGLGCGFIT